MFFQGKSAASSGTSSICGRPQVAPRSVDYASTSHLSPLQSPFASHPHMASFHVYGPLVTNALNVGSWELCFLVDSRIQEYSGASLAFVMRNCLQKRNLPGPQGPLTL